MRLRAFMVVLAAAIVCTGAFLFGHSYLLQAHSAPLSLPPANQAVPPATSVCCGGQAGVGLRELDFPYYNLTNGYVSTLYLLSDSPKPMDFTLGVRSSSGEMLTTPETIQPGGKLSIDLASLIAKLGGDPQGAYSEGSVAVYYIGTIMPIVGQISVRNPQLRLEHQSEMVENDPGRSDVPAVLNGEWWGLIGNRSAQVMVSNTSNNVAVAEVDLDFQGKRHPVGTPLTFGSYETKVLDIAQLLLSVGADPANVPQGGITITQAGPHPALIANGKITDIAEGFSSTIYFPAPEVERASAVHASGLPVGTPSNDSPYAGAGVFIPHVIVRNLLSSPQTVTIAVEYPVQPDSASLAIEPNTNAATTQTGTTVKPVIPRPAVPGDKDHHPEWGVGMGGSTGSITAATFALGPYSTQDISLASIMSQLPLPLPFCSIRVQYSGVAGSLVTQVASVDQTRSLVVDAMVENEGNGWASSGANPWHLDSQTDSILFLTNESSKPARIGFSVTANGVHYFLTQLKLQPRETRAISIRALRDSQIADFKKNLISATATDGSVSWIRIDNVPVMGRLMVISRHSHTAATYDCCVCACPLNFAGFLSMDPIIFALEPGSNMACSCSGEYQDCNFNVYWNDVTSGATWWSDNTGVAVIDSVWSNQVDEVGYGFADITANYTDCGAYEYQGGPNPCNCLGTNTGSDSAQDINSFTYSQHTYPSGPFSGCRVSTPFDAVINHTTGARHNAQDVTANGLYVGSPVYAAEGGTITFIQSGYSHVNEPVSQCAGQGFHANYIVIQNGSLVTRYVHVTALPGLSQGSPVNTGDEIGTVDISGCTSGPHTHMSARLNGSLINFTLPCDNSHFDDAGTWYDDSDGLD